MAKPRVDLLKLPGPPPRPSIPDAVRPRIPARTLWFHHPAPWSGEMAVATSGAENGRRIADYLTLHHDATRGLPAVSPGENGGLVLETDGFDGSFLSLAIGMSISDARAIHPHDLIRLQTRIVTRNPQEVFARLNLVHGPGKQEIAFQLPQDGPERMVEWDLYFTGWNPARAKDVWIDLIFGHPRQNRIEIQDVFALRHPRAYF